MATDANLNFAQCIKSTADLGVTHVHNICTGTVTHLSWGSVDWLAFIGFGSLVTAAALTFLALGVMIVRD